MAPREEETAPVIIAGGGMVGLSAAAFLAHQGVRAVVIERLTGSSPLPRAAFFHMRTLEMFRSIGIETAVRTQSEREFVPDGGIVAMDCVAGRKLADIIPSLNEGVEAVSPCQRLFLNQPSLEPILRSRAREAGATVLEGTDLTGVEQDADGVRVQVTGPQGPRTLRSRYLIAADGGHSRVREVLGIPSEGRGAFSNSLTIYFRADLSPWLGGKLWSIVYVNNPVLGGFFRMDRAAQVGFLAINIVGDPNRDPEAASNAAADVSERRLIELVRGGVGVPDLPVEVTGMTRWRARAEWARDFRAGRVFIAGDAAHQMPPNGGFGGNTGIHDVHNLAWKLAAVLNGHASPELLASYESERKPVGRFTVEQAFARYVTRTAPWLRSRHPPEPLAPDFDIELGYLYGAPEVHVDPRTTFGIPGSRAPHVWLLDGTRRISTIDLTGRFLLLTGPAGTPWVQAGRRLASKLGGLVLDAYRIGGDLGDPDERFAAAYGIGASGASLVRPDGFVAWRSPAAASDPEQVLGQALRRALGFT